MKHFDLLEHKRKQVFEYKDDVPSLEKIKLSLWQAWKTTPSKNNAMAYEVFVWGPDKQKEKEIIYNICQNSCIEIDHQGQSESISKGNKYLKHIKDNPFLFTFWPSATVTAVIAITKRLSFFIDIDVFELIPCSV